MWLLQLLSTLNNATQVKVSEMADFAVKKKQKLSSLQYCVSVMQRNTLIGYFKSSLYVISKLP